MADYSEMIQGVRRVYNSGKTKPYEWRYKQLQGMLKLLDENRDAIVNALREDLHKPKFEANLSEIDYCRNDLIDTMNNLSTWMKPEKVKKKIINIMDNAYVHRDPYGVVLVMGAWNYPIQLTVMPVYGALSAGNCVVLKPSEVSPATAKLLEELIPKYIDNDAVKVVNGGIPETTALLKERFDYIFYTGNSAVGKIVMQAAAKYLTPVTLELGGKSPVYVDENSDMNIAARRILWGKCSNAGQTCIAPDYVMCTKEAQDKLVAEMKKTLDDFFPESSISKTDDFGRIVNSRHFQRVKKLMDSSGRVAVGGETNENENFIAPTILTDCKEEDPALQEEIFGPVLPIMPVRNEDEAIDFINKREKPLSMYVFTKNPQLGQKFRDTTSSGSFVVNDTIMQAGVMTLPFGGVGNSGMGAYHGHRTFDTFCHQKAVLERQQKMESAQSIRYPPYSDNKYAWIRRLAANKPKKSGLVSVIPFFLLGTLMAFLYKTYSSSDSLSKLTSLFSAFKR